MRYYLAILTVCTAFLLPAGIPAHAADDISYTMKSQEKQELLYKIQKVKKQYFRNAPRNMFDPGTGKLNTKHKDYQEYLVKWKRSKKKLEASFRREKFELNRKITNAEINVTRRKYHEHLDSLATQFENKIPKGAYKNGRLDTSSPGYQKAFRKYKNKVMKARQKALASDTRLSDINSTLEGLGIDPKTFGNTGSPPSSIESDMDFMTKSNKEAKKVMTALKKKGHVIEDFSDRWVDHSNDMTVWKKGHAPKTGSSAADARVHFMGQKGSDAFTPTGLESTIPKKYVDGKKIAVYDPEGAVLANANKFRDSFASTNHPDWATASKSVLKSQKAAGLRGKNPKLETQMSCVRKRIPLGICLGTFGMSKRGKRQALNDYKEALRQEMGNAYSGAQKRGGRLDKKRVEAIEKASKAGDMDRVHKIQKERVSSKSGNKAALDNLASESPEFAAELTTGERFVGVRTKDGDVVYRNSETGMELTHSEIKEKVGSATRKDIAMKNTFDNKPGEISLEAKAKGSSLKGKAVKVAGHLMNLINMYDSAQRGAEKAVAEEQESDSGLKTNFKAWAYGLWYNTSIPDAMDMTKSTVYSALDEISGKNEKNEDKRQKIVEENQHFTKFMWILSKHGGKAMWELGKGMSIIMVEGATGKLEEWTRTIDVAKLEEEAELTQVKAAKKGLMKAIAENTAKSGKPLTTQTYITPKPSPSIKSPKSASTSSTKGGQLQSEAVAKQTVPDVTPSPRLGLQPGSQQPSTVAPSQSMQGVGQSKSGSYGLSPQEIGRCRQHITRLDQAVTKLKEARRNFINTQKIFFKQYYEKYLLPAKAYSQELDKRGLKIDALYQKVKAMDAAGLKTQADVDAFNAAATQFNKLNSAYKADAEAHNQKLQRYRKFRDFVDALTKEDCGQQVVMFKSSWPVREGLHYDKQTSMRYCQAQGDATMAINGAKSELTFDRCMDQDGKLVAGILPGKKQSPKTKPQTKSQKKKKSSEMSLCSFAEKWKFSGLAKSNTESPYYQQCLNENKHRQGGIGAYVQGCVMEKHCLAYLSPQQRGCYCTEEERK